MGFSSARNLGRDISAGFSPPRRMPISEAVKKFMRVPKGAGNSVPWDTAVYSGPVMPWIDPVKEAEAWKIQIRGGAATESDWVTGHQQPVSAICWLW